MKPLTSVPDTAQADLVICAVLHLAAPLLIGIALMASGWA